MSANDRIEPDEGVCEGDLGMGYGLRPGSLPMFPLRDIERPRSSPSLMTSPAPTAQLRVAAPTQAARRSSPLERLSEKLGLVRKSKSTPVEDVTNVPESCTESASEVGMIGTSLRQQRQLYEQELNDIQRRRLIDNQPFDPEAVVSVSSRSQKDNVDASTLLQELKSTQQEAEILRENLESCEQQFSAKSQAIRILLQQWNAASKNQKTLTEKAEQRNEQLIKDLNRIQFEMEYRQSSLIQSQQVWVARFDSVCCENLELKKEISDLRQEIKKNYTEKMSLCRERDELVALLNSREHSCFEMLSSVNAVSTAAAAAATAGTNCGDTNNNNNNTARSCRSDATDAASLKIAVLGSCHCRNTSDATGSSACQCAVLAAQFAHDVATQNKANETLKQRYDESLVTVDAYRIAFEEQLTRNKSLTRQIALLLSSGSDGRPSLELAAVEKLSERVNSCPVINGNTDANCTSDCNSSDAVELLDAEVAVSQCNNSSVDAITTLLDMVNDRSEALAHQRLAARLLAHRTQQLENKLLALSASESIATTDCQSSANNDTLTVVEATAVMLPVLDAGPGLVASLLDTATNTSSPSTDALGCVAASVNTAATTLSTIDILTTYTRTDSDQTS